MSSQKSRIPSNDSDSTTKTADIATSDTHHIDEKVLDTCGKNEEGLKPIDYRGTMTRPLAYFGKFQVKPETEKVPWISDNTSGKVHRDMRTISMLFNEDLTLPQAARNFIAQSPVIQEEARWERVKAAFYSLYPEDVKKQVFEVLSEMLPRKASQIIAMKTLRFENEILFIPKPKSTTLDDESDSETESDLSVGADSCTKEDAMKVNKQLPKIAREHRKQTVSTLKLYKKENKKLSTYSSFSGEEAKDELDVFKKSKLWTEGAKKYQQATQKCACARFISHHLDHAVARFDPRTGWIHVKTQLLRPGLQDNKSLPKDIFEFKLNSKLRIRGSTQEQNAAVDKQMELFEQELRTLSTGHLSTLESYHNDLLYHEYEVRIPYVLVKPSLCQTIVKKLYWRDFHIASQPQVHRIQKLHHVLKVYLNIDEAKLREKYGHGKCDAIAEIKNRYGCCLNCYSKDHSRVTCEQPVYAFAHQVKMKDAN